MQIGEVADRTGLSLRTIRYYGEVGLVTPSARTTGGFRLYGEADVERLQLVKRMKVLEFTIEEMRDLLGLLDQSGDRPAAEAGQRPQDADKLQMYREAIEARCEALREQLAQAQTFATRLDQQLKHHEAHHR